MIRKEIIIFGKKIIEPKGENYMLFKVDIIE